MYSFRNDYSECCHPAILERLAAMGTEANSGYGTDIYCSRAATRIRQAIQCPDASVHFLTGGTQTNMTVIDAALRPFQAVIAAESGHISVHETGAVEGTGHKVLTAPSPDGKLTPAMIQDILDRHTDEHMVQPKMVYLSDLPRLCDVFYIGGTKNGALFGEAVVILHPRLAEDFRYQIKHRGGMLAKGFLLGVNFDTLFTDRLYERLAEAAHTQAARLRQGLADRQIPFFVDSPTNQLFPVFSNEKLAKLEHDFIYEIWEPVDENHTCIRLVTSWTTSDEAVDAFLYAVEH